MSLYLFKRHTLECEVCSDEMLFLTITRLLSYFKHPMFVFDQGAALCTHYAQRGICKFGPACKFDHPIAPLTYSPSASSLTDVPVAPYFVGSSVGTLVPSSSSPELQSELTAGSSRESVPSRISSSVSTSTGSAGLTLPTGGPVSQSSTRSSSPLAPANTTTSSNVSHPSN